MPKRGGNESKIIELEDLSFDPKREPAALKPSTREIALEALASDPQLATLKPQVESISHQSSLPTLEQTEVLKKYITLKEAEVRDYKEQRRQADQLLKRLTQELKETSERLYSTTEELDLVRRREEVLRLEIRDLKERHSLEVERIKNDLQEGAKRSDYVKQEQLDLNSKREEWQLKVKEDLKRIRLKERELENKYELLKRDMQALIDSKDQHVLELKKKNDALELELESLEDRLRAANAVLGNLDIRKQKLTETLKLALTLLEALESPHLTPGKKRGAP